MNYSDNLTVGTQSKLKTINRNNKIKGIILAAGKGVRAYPATKYIPKALLDVGGRTLIEKNIQIMRDQLNIKDIIIVVGYLGDKIIELLEGKFSSLNFTFVRQEIQNGIGHALMNVKPYVGEEPFLVMLADEFYLDSNHAQLKDFFDMDADAVLMFKKERDKNKISKNYTGVIRENKIVSLVEKPENPDTFLMGTGTYFFFNNKIFSYIESTPPSSLRGEIEITDVLSKMAQKENLHSCLLEGTYININTVSDLNMANYVFREKYFDTYTVSIVIPAYNEENSIGNVVEEYKSHNNVHEIIVVDNNSKDRTFETAVKAGARVVKEMNQGYGYALKRGMDEAKGEIIILTEADGSFQARDIPKFLQYLKDCDMVIGTRTTRQMIEQGANMAGLLRWGNVIVGKLIEALWWSQEPRFTDVGCTFRAIWKTSYLKIRPYLSAKGPDFAPEMMIAVLICRRRIIEIPVSYRSRVSGDSKHSGNFPAQARTALKMLRLIFKNRFIYP